MEVGGFANAFGNGSRSRFSSSTCTTCAGSRADGRLDRRHERGGRDRLDSARGNHRRQDRRQADAGRLTRAAGDRLRRLRIRARALAGVPDQRGRRDRKRRLLAEPVGAHHRAHPACPQARGLRAPAGHAQPRARARGRGRWPDRDDRERHELLGAVRSRRAHVSRFVLVLAFVPDPGLSRAEAEAPGRYREVLRNRFSSRSSA